ncbi:DUF2510 domain-containing protein [Streptomyces peucetius]|nr:DUF2510 domain-containing protein [Streptomyces peucetius]
MSMTTPPGWYPDPQAPHTERWWDGTAWTAHSRAAQAGDGAQGQAQPYGPGLSFGPPQPHTAAMPQAGDGGTGGGGNRRLIALAVAGVVLVAAVAGGAVLLGGDEGESTPEASPSSTAPAAPATADPENPGNSTGPSPTESNDATVLEDQLNGITLAIPDGWVRATSSLEEGATIYVDETYDCPAGGSSLCRHARVSSLAANAPSADTTAKTLAEQDVAEAAEAVYGEDRLGNRPHGGIESHKVLKSQNVAVAGKAGYLVRWRVVTGESTGGYVQTIAFPSPAGTGALMVVRFAFDAASSAPGLEVMDEIAASIRPAGDATGGGVGSSIGPG